MTSLLLRVNCGANRAPKGYRVWVTCPAEPDALRADAALYVDLLRALKRDLQRVLRTSAADEAAPTKRSRAPSSSRTSVVNDAWAYEFTVPEEEDDAKPGAPPGVLAREPAESLAPQTFSRLALAPFEIRVRLMRRTDVAAALGAVPRS